VQVARTLGRKVYVCAAKRGVMGCLGLAPPYASLLTTNHLETNIHAVPMAKVTMDAMQQLLGSYRGR
jgi:DNA cross-link repair 1A protein